MNVKEKLERAGFFPPDPLICYACFFATADPAIHSNDQERRTVDCQNLRKHDPLRGCLRTVITRNKLIVEAELIPPTLREKQAPRGTTTSLLYPIPFECPVLRAK